jgi:small-conductance mechanosensitive channel
VSDFLQALNLLSASRYRVVAALVVLLVGYLLYGLLSRSLHSLTRQGHLPPAMEARLRAIARIIAVLATLLIAVQQIGAFDNAWAVLSALLTTVAIGFFAIWSVLSNLVCALLILIFRPFRVGDQIELIEGAAPYPQGRVVDMNLLFVSLEERRENGGVASLQIPNTLFFQKVVRRYHETHEVESRLSFFG